jgi:hypothetical protein
VNAGRKGRERHKEQRIEDRTQSVDESRGEQSILEKGESITR